MLSSFKISALRFDSQPGLAVVTVSLGCLHRANLRHRHLHGRIAQHQDGPDSPFHPSDPSD